MTAERLLEAARAEGLYLWLEAERLRWRGKPRAEMLDGLRAERAGIIALLRAEEDEVARRRAGGARAVAGVVATSDEGELLVKGEP